MQSPVKQVLPADNTILTLAIFHKVNFVWFYPTGRGATIFSGVAASSQGHYLSAAKPTLSNEGPLKIPKNFLQKILLFLSSIHTKKTPGRRSGGKGRLSQKETYKQKTPLAGCHGQVYTSPNVGQPHALRGTPLC